MQMKVWMAKYHKYSWSINYLTSLADRAQTEAMDVGQNPDLVIANLLDEVEEQLNRAVAAFMIFGMLMFLAMIFMIFDWVASFGKFGTLYCPGGAIVVLGFALSYGCNFCVARSTEMRWPEQILLSFDRATLLSFVSKVKAAST